MNKIFCIMGKSSSGKDTIYNLIKGEFRFENLLPVVTYTTRPMRDGEISDKTYHFISMDEMNELEKNGELIERRDYNTVNGIWSYATGIHSFEANHNYILITTPAAYEKIKRKISDFEIIPIYIEVNDYIRLTRALNREKMNEKQNYAEVCRRFLADEKDFSEEILDKLQIRNRFNNDYDCFNEVESFIRSAMNQSNQESKLGDWIALTDCSNEGIYCSNCNKKVFKFQYANQKIDSNYCPNCGMKMKKGIKKIVDV